MKAFDVIVNHIHDFHVIVKNMSVVNSLLANIEYGTYKLIANIQDVLSVGVNIKSSIKMQVGIMLEVINEKIDFKNKSKIDATISSVEKLSPTNMDDIIKIEAIIASKENISDTVKSTLRMVVDPTVGYFRKLAEFDGLALRDMDIFTLDELDYIVALMSDEE